MNRGIVLLALLTGVSAPVSKQVFTAIYYAISAGTIAVADVHAEPVGAVRVEPRHQCVVDRQLGFNGRVLSMG